MAVFGKPEREARDARLPSGRAAAAERPAGQRGERRRWLAVAAYGVLLILTFATITDRRILWVTVAVLLVLMGLTLFRREAEGVPAPWRRAADVREDGMAAAAPAPPAPAEWSGESS